MNKIPKECYFELAVFLMDYHSGQWSRGYRLLSKLRMTGSWSSRLCDEMRQSETYEYLVANYAESV
jgi:hypothetical protein